MRNYPMHDKLKAVEAQKEAVTDFLEWLRTANNWAVGRPVLVAGGIAYCGRCGSDVECDWPAHGTIVDVDRGFSDRDMRDILADYFGIDQDVLEQEKRAMLEELRLADTIRTNVKMKKERTGCGPGSGVKVKAAES